MKKYAIALMLLTLPIIIDGQMKKRTVPNGLSTVQKYRQLFPTPMGADNTVKFLKLVAGDLHGGLYRKTSGNNCNGYSCDFVCFPNEGVMFDTLGDSEGAANPTWNGPQQIPDMSLCDTAVVTQPIPVPVPVPTPTPTDPIDPGATSALQQQEIVLLMQMLQKQEEQNAALRSAITDLKAEIAKGVKIRF